MKLFAAEDREKSFVSDTNYNWCDKGEILLFGHFTKGNAVSMYGIQSKAFTTNILVKELDIHNSFLIELVKISVEDAMECIVTTDGSYVVSFGDGWDFDFNINSIVDELIKKAEIFKEGEKVICIGRTLYLTTKPQRAKKKNYVR